MRASAAASEDLLAQINRLRVENDELRSKIIPPFEGLDQLADIEASFTVHYRYEEYDRTSNIVRTPTATLSIDWKRLFILLAPQFSKPRAAILESTLETALKEKSFIPKARERISFYETDIRTIEAQLLAYGFISREVGGNASRFLQLTPVGQKRYLEWVTIKSEGNVA